jgi:hypothetical protein
MPEHRQACTAPLVERDEQHPIRPVTIGHVATSPVAIKGVAIRVCHGR